LKVIAKLPELKHFEPIRGTDSWPHAWAAIYSDRLRVYSRISSPWQHAWILHVSESKANTDKVSQTNRLDLRCSEIYTGTPIDLPFVDIILEHQYGGVPHSNRPTIRFYVLPNSYARKYLMLSVCAACQPIAAIPTTTGGNKDKPLMAKTNSAMTTIGGAELANADRTNDERADEVSQAITEAVRKLRVQYPDWLDLPTRRRIDLLKSQTKEDRGFAVSNQTLYRDWNRDLW
jgi:hypothetical protein